MARGLAVYLGSVRASHKIHAALLKNVLSFPKFYFDHTPVGRILNRFGSDMDVVDNLMASNFYSWFGSTLKLIRVPIIVAYSTPLFLAAAVPLAIFVIVIQVGSIYVCVSSSLQDPWEGLWHCNPYLTVLEFVQLPALLAITSNSDKD